MAGFDILNIVGDPWNDTDSVFGGIKLEVTDTASHSTSTFLEFVLNGAPIYSVLKNGETVISDASGASRGGMALIGGAGEMALTSQLDLNTGAGAQVLRYYWEDANNVGSDPDSVAVIHGMGNNRLSIESNGAIVHIANNGRYEFETQSYPIPVQFVGYGAASGDGVPFLFNNHNQTSYPASVVQVGVDANVHHALEVGRWDGTTFTANAYIDGAGAIYGRAMTAFGPTGFNRGIGTRNSNSLVPSVFVGMNRDDVPYIAFGTGGAFDTYIYRAGPNLFSIGAIGSAATPAIKGFGTAIQGRLGDDSDFCTVQGKLTTDQTAVNETITPDSTLTLYDAAGTAYKVPCIAA